MFKAIRKTKQNRLLFALVVGFAASVSAQSSLAQHAPSAAARVSTHAPAAASAARAKAKWKIGLAGASFADLDHNESAQTAALELGARVRMRLLPVVDFNAEGAVLMATGQAQSRFGDHVPTSGLLLKEALVNLRPLDALTLSAGAIDQGHLQAPLLVSARAFPGALERVKFGGRAFSIEARAQQTVPTSITMTTKTGLGEPAPSFLSETLSVKARLLDALEVSANGTHFAFRDLPAQVALDSQVHGNTVVELGPNTSRFAYSFEGWTAGGSGRLELAPGFAFSAGAQLVQNTRAPGGFRNAQSVHASAEVEGPHEILIKPRGEVFFSESDTSPAFYNSTDFGHNNRKGFAADLEMEFKREKFRVGGRYVDAGLIDADLHQGRWRHWMLRFETMYAGF